MPFVLLVPPDVLKNCYLQSKSLQSLMYIKCPPSTQTLKIHVPMFMCCYLESQKHRIELGRTFEGHPVPSSCNEQLQPEQAAQSLIQLEPQCSQAWRFHQPDHKDILPCIQFGIYICVYWISQLIKIDLYYLYNVNCGFIHYFNYTLE